MSELRTLPVYALGMMSSVAHGALLVPSLLHRVLLRREGAGQDILLNAVRELREAGVESPTQQAGLLQLPVDLTDFLDQQVRFGAAEGNGGARSEVRFVVQCRLTGRVWGQALRDTQPAEVQYADSGWPRRIVMGSAGRPSYERVFAIAKQLAPPPIPTSSQIVDALRRSDRFAGATLIGEPREVFMRVFIGTDAANAPVVLDPVDYRLDADLTGRIRQLAEDDANLAKWIAPPAAVTRPAMSELARLRRAFQDAQAAARGRGLRDGVTLGTLSHAAELLLHGILGRLSRHFPLSHPPFSSMERAHRVAAALPSTSPSALPTRVASPLGESELLERVADAILGLSQNTTAAARDHGMDAESLADVGLMLADRATTLSPDASLPDLERNVRRLSEGLDALAETAMHLEAVRG